MSQTPITVTYSLEEILVRFEQKIDKIDEKIDKLEDKFDEKIDRLEARIDEKIDQLEARIDQKIDKLEEKFDEKIDKFEEKFDKLEEKFDKLDEKVDQLALGQADIKGDIKALNEKVEGLGKRLDNQEFLSRGIIIGLGVAILGGFAKVFGWIGNP